MNKQEFNNRVEMFKGEEPTLTEQQYKTIEYVYTWHPAIDAVKGKDQIAYLYSEFGMRVIYDMLPTAQEAEDAEQELELALQKYEDAKARYDKLKQGTK